MLVGGWWVVEWVVEWVVGGGVGGGCWVVRVGGNVSSG